MQTPRLTPLRPASPLSYHPNSSSFSLNMVRLSQIVHELSSYPALYAEIHFHHLCTFFDIIGRFRPAIFLAAPRSVGDLPPLPGGLRELLSVQMLLSLREIDSLWSCLGPISLLAVLCMKHTCKETDQYLSSLGSLNLLGMCVLKIPYKHCLTQSIGAEIMVTPIPSCSTPNCSEAGKPLA